VTGVRDTRRAEEAALVTGEECSSIRSRWMPAGGAVGAMASLVAWRDSSHSSGRRPPD